MKKRIFAILVLVAFTAGCAKTARIGRPPISEMASQEIAEPKPSFIVGEKFTYLIAWKGIPVGTATATIEELTTFKEYEVYKIVVIAETNDFLSKLYRVEDRFTSYMDKDKLVSRHYEAIQREGKYRKHLVVDYDFQKYIATYKNLKDGSVKTCRIEKNVQDPVSAAYFFRTVPLRVGDKIKIIVNLNEKNYDIFGAIDKRASITLSEMGTFDAFLIKPYVKLKGKRLRRANVWGYLSADKKRLGLFWVLKVLEIPWIGEVTATLKKVEYISSS
ncbi:MAG: DUF3108 domain-containing protein [Candidatus Omnitrophota bacterium]